MSSGMKQGQGRLVHLAAKSGALTNECFPITGPETHYLGIAKLGQVQSHIHQPLGRHRQCVLTIGYETFAEKPFQNTLARLRGTSQGEGQPPDDQ